MMLLDIYIISYTGGGSSDSVTVSGGSTNERLLTGLTNGESTPYLSWPHQQGSPVVGVEVMDVALGEYKQCLNAT